MYKTLSAIAMATLLSGCVVHIGGSTNAADTHIEQELVLDASQLSKLVAETGAGSLKIIGSDSSDKITVNADIYTSEALNYELSLSQHGDTAKLIAEHDLQDGFHIHINQGHSIDLVITMPSKLALELDDSSGDITIKGLNNTIKVDDSSGDLTIDGGKSVYIDDSSGSLYVTNIQGDVEIEDGSGDSTVENTKGAVTIEDGSGDVVVRNVAGTVKVDDGSGDIRVNGAGGLIVEDDGSGDLDIDNVKGEVKID
ncbi:hypothetical protein [Pseudoalteromonas sp. G4]|uniref:hypothetical protein n=1 Tax=Pseudoalteromonas sp. G4 TaxID=2992761 RepID=UPI00237EBA8C|nr:hypothetical protein [Pseudoalteromonas sp. G4]MDE3270958.1 hypothetical protein [Pseudoalteromonas sp. G4]